MNEEKLTLEKLRGNISAKDWTTYIVQHIPELLSKAQFIEHTLQMHEMEVYGVCVEENGSRMITVPESMIVEVIKEGDIYDR